MPEKYRALVGVDCRKSQDRESPEHGQFQRWNAGDVIDLATAPAHLNVRWLLKRKAIEPIAEKKAVRHGKE